MSGMLIRRLFLLLGIFLELSLLESITVLPMFHLPFSSLNDHKFKTAPFSDFQVLNNTLLRLLSLPLLSYYDNTERGAV